jgi:hypothetical protein
MPIHTKIFQKPCQPRQFRSTNEHLGIKHFENDIGESKRGTAVSRRTATHYTLHTYMSYIHIEYYK